MGKVKVLFLCMNNSARSQMAEGFLNALYGNRYKAYSAGIVPTKINPYVIKVMAEVGIDVSKNRSKSIQEFHAEHFDYVITVCDDAKEACPFFPGDNVLHKGFQDPSKFKGTDDEILKEIAKAIGLNPEEILTKEALAKPHRTVVTSNEKPDLEQNQIDTLLAALRQQLRQDFTPEQDTTLKTV